MLMHTKMSTSNMREMFLVLLGLYVDNCVMMSNDITLLEKKKLDLTSKFHMLVLASHYCLGVQITKDQIERID
jgi:hypothetical protein